MHTCVRDAIATHRVTGQPRSWLQAPFALRCDRRSCLSYGIRRIERMAQSAFLFKLGHRKNRKNGAIELRRLRPFFMALGFPTE